MTVTAVVLALFASAFTTVSTEATATRAGQWFILKAGGDSMNPDDYSPTSIQPCNSTGNVCGVFDEEDSSNPGHPLLSASAQYVRKP